MLVKCPGCLTTYRVGKNLVKSKKPAFRCSRCKLIFALELKSHDDSEQEKRLSSDSIQLSTDSEPELPFTASEDETTADKPVSPSEYFSHQVFSEQQEEEPSIPTSLSRGFHKPKDSRPSAFSVTPSSRFSESLPPETPEDNPPREESQQADQEPPTHNSEQPPAQSFEEIFGKPKDEFPESPEVPESPAPQSWKLEGPETPTPASQESATAPEPETVEESEPEPAFELSFDDLASNEERRERKVVTDPLRGGGSLSVIPYVSLFGFLILVFSLTTLMHQTQPERLEGYLKSVPWFGSALFKNKHLRHGVVVGSLQTGYQRILGNREVFVISGRIYNRNPVSIGEVQVEGQIHTSGEKELASQAISVGNPISSKIIRDMTVREIAILQRLRPQKKFEVAPQGSAGFTIVFLKPSKKIKSFSCRVLSAKGSI